MGKRRWFTYAGAITLAFMACTDSPVAVDAHLEPQFAKGGGGLLHLVTGSGHAFYGPRQNIYGAFSFTAREHANGAVSGQFQLTLMEPVGGSENPAIASVHAEVTCLEVLPITHGPVAWIAGVIKSSSIPSFLGKGVGFAVRDFGQGESSPPDLIRTISPSPPGTVHEANVRCATRVLGGVTLEVARGNIQIR